MRTVFFGTPEWAVPTLRALLDSDIEVVGVVTNPDRPAGRGMELRPSPVKQVALEAGLDIRQPEKARDPELADWLRTKEVDAATVVAYGKILPADLLAIPDKGFVNVHFSLLPAYRGAAPVQRAVMDGAEETGVAIMVLTEGMDEGPVLASEPIAIAGETSGEVGARLASIGAPLLVDSLRGYLQGTIEPVEQDHSRATYASKITTEEARIDWSRPAPDIDNLVRGLNPVPGAWTLLRDERVKVHAVGVRPEPEPLEPGVISVSDDAVIVGTGRGTVELLDVQVAGRKRMSGIEAARGLRLSPGEALE